MKLEYLGHSCFKITASDGTRIVTDPYTGIGYEMERTAADYVTCSHFHFDHGYVQGVSGYREVISEPGEYRCGTVRVTGYGSYHDDVKGAKRGKNVIFVFEADGVRVCHLGDLGERLSAELCEKIGKADFLLIPVGGTYTIDAAGALQAIGVLEPVRAVAMHFKSEGCGLDIAPITELEKAAKGRCVHTGSELPMRGNEGKILIPERR